ncbi:hypothetical protein U1E44_11260 [Arenibacter sp. GZD96]|uniref:hypothetical protein n=1 Tax=Aurantibrevibacter litoralis TaxID=3106030 RepID=UPI002B003CCD|nr:hypothetical protein [Arenibacter sp. GZD-96]MEA1786672.1 hypothetical protein [Arenibacter sp. GZD-96]
MKKFLRILGISILGISLSSCDIDDGVNFHFQPLQIVSAELPESFVLNEVFDITVTFIIPDNCTLFERFTVSRTATTTRQVAVMGAVLDKDDCINSDQEVTRTFKFEVKYTDTYLFQFYTGEDENGNPVFLEIEVPVDPGATTP